MRRPVLPTTRSGRAATWLVVAALAAIGLNLVLASSFGHRFDTGYFRVVRMVDAALFFGAGLASGVLGALAIKRWGERSYGAWACLALRSSCWPSSSWKS